MEGATSQCTLLYIIVIVEPRNCITSFTSVYFNWYLINKRITSLTGVGVPLGKAGFKSGTSVLKLMCFMHCYKVTLHGRTVIMTITLTGKPCHSLRHGKWMKTATTLVWKVLTPGEFARSHD